MTHIRSLVLALLLPISLVNMYVTKPADDAKIAFCAMKKMVVSGNGVPFSPEYIDAITSTGSEAVLFPSPSAVAITLGSITGLGCAGWRLLDGFLGYRQTINDAISTTKHVALVAQEFERDKNKEADLKVKKIKKESEEEIKRIEKESEEKFQKFTQETKVCMDNMVKILEGAEKKVKRSTANHNAVKGLSLQQLQLLAVTEADSNPSTFHFRNLYAERLADSQASVTNAASKKKDFTEEEF